MTPTDLEGIPILNNSDNDDNDDDETDNNMILLERHGICCVKIPTHLLDVQYWAKELSQVTPMNLQFEGDNEYPFYRNIMEEDKFPFNAILSSQIGQSIIQHFPIQQQSEIRLDDAFCVHYNMDQYDTSGAKHMDPSDITINMCLHKADDTEGSYVLFHGTKQLSSSSSASTEDERQQLPALYDRFLVNQRPGYATIHFGDHPHETTPLLKGSRTNVILTYCYTDTSRSDVATRTCY